MIHKLIPKMRYSSADMINNSVGIATCGLHRNVEMESAKFAVDYNAHCRRLGINYFDLGEIDCNGHRSFPPAGFPSFKHINNVLHFPKALHHASGHSGG